MALSPGFLFFFFFSNSCNCSSCTRRKEAELRQCVMLRVLSSFYNKCGRGKFIFVISLIESNAGLIF